MSGTSSSTQNTQQQSQTNPWAPTIGSLNSLIGGISGLIPGATGNATTGNAFNTILQNAQATPDYSPQALGYASNLIGGGGAMNYAPMVQGAYGQVQQAFNPILSGSLNPMDTPGIGQALQTTQQDITNAINGQFAAAGRDLSPANSQALARGLAQGMAPILTNQYNANVGNVLSAGSGLNTAAGNAAGQLAGMQQTQLGNQGQGFNWLTSGLPNATSAGALNTVNASQMPLQYATGNLGSIEQLLNPIAALGGQSTGTSSTQGTQTMSPFQMAMMGLNTAANLGFKFSDVRLKQDIERVGQLDDGTPIYRYRYRCGGAWHIGLLAHHVENYAPEAVRTDMNGFKMVDYRAATERAAAMARTR